MNTSQSVQISFETKAMKKGISLFWLLLRISSAAAKSRAQSAYQSRFITTEGAAFTEDGSASHRARAPLTSAFSAKVQNTFEIENPTLSGSSRISRSKIRSAS